MKRRYEGGDYNNPDYATAPPPLALRSDAGAGARAANADGNGRAGNGNPWRDGNGHSHSQPNRFPVADLYADSASQPDAISHADGYGRAHSDANYHANCLRANTPGAARRSPVGDCAGQVRRRPAQPGSMPG